MQNVIYILDYNPNLRYELYNLKYKFILQIV